MAGQPSVSDEPNGASAGRVATLSPCRVDEGFSGEYDTNMDSVKRWLLSQPLDVRAELGRTLLSSLPNHTLGMLFGEAHDRLHIDPIKTLPQEIVEAIYEYLDPVSLLNASLVSQAWRDRAQEPRLWRRLYTLEGWTYNRDHVKGFEERARVRLGFQGRSSRRPRSGATSPESERHEMKRARNHSDRRNNDVLHDVWAEQVGVVEADEETHGGTPSYNDAMQGVVYNRPPGRAPLVLPASDTDPLGDRAFDRTLQSNLVVFSETHGPVINWQKLYSERHRMELNWTVGNFKNFRLPVMNHQYEAHTLCVYTMQYTAKYLVSGSRDKTVRIWCLATGRLMLPPLRGHLGSVLCLQFDERPEQDVIISGGSDSGIIVWRFSTGAKIKAIPKAHTQPVLMLRFDERYLVTCSKDYYIKVWNRRQLSPTDADYPKTNVSRNAVYPDYIVNLQGESTLWEQPSFQPLEPYSLLMTLHDHKAAVNAISIVGNQIVSASGDRKIKLWDIPTGTLIRTYSGHTKGIACVQYDGRRIISGSSDMTIRVFDAVTSAQVAFLEGHRDLVRTLQAEFGDTNDPDAGETLRLEALRHARMVRQSGFQGDPRQFVTGARIPPGGGGTRWSRIVSGSYDETVKIWKKDRMGRWQVARELRQDDALIRAGTESGGSLVPYPWTSERTNAQLDQGFPARQRRPQEGLEAGHRPHDDQRSNLPSAHPAALNPGQGASAQAAQPAPHQQPSQTPLHSVQGPPAVNAALPGPAPRPARAEAPLEYNNARLFKLQFDARRIICCSQQSIIVGWDFANNDEALMDASYFFGKPSMTGC